MGQKMETNEVSMHQCRVFSALLSSAASWLTSREVASKAEVAQRTARAHLLKLVNLGIVDQAEVFPAHRYRLSSKADKRNKTYFRRIEIAAKIFGVIP